MIERCQNIADVYVLKSTTQFILQSIFAIEQLVKNDLSRLPQLFIHKQHFSHCNFVTKKNTTIAIGVDMSAKYS